MNYQFHEKSKFALLTVNNVYTDLPDATIQLSDGTWIMPELPVPDLDIWKEWLGSSHMERLGRANLVLIVEEPSNNPGVLDDVHKRLTDDLCCLFFMLHLRPGIEIAEGADLLSGCSMNWAPQIRQIFQMPKFYKTKGWPREPLTKDWLTDSLVLRSGYAVMKAEAKNKLFERVVRGLHTLSKGLREASGQDRLHQFVRSLEALILPEPGHTKKQFAHRCQTFTCRRDNTRSLLTEAFDMRSATEHLNRWDKAVEKYPSDKREDVCMQRTRQIELLACDVYSRLLRDPDRREHFRTDDAINAFWKLPDHKRYSLWDTHLDISQEPVVQEYDSWGRPMRDKENLFCAAP